MNPEQTFNLAILQAMARGMGPDRFPVLLLAYRPSVGDWRILGNPALANVIHNPEFVEAIAGVVRDLLTQLGSHPEHMVMGGPMSDWQDVEKMVGPLNCEPLPPIKEGPSNGEQAE